MVTISKLTKKSKPICIVDQDDCFTLHPLSMTAEQYRRWLWQHIKTRNSVEWEVLKRLANLEKITIHYRKPQAKPYAEVLGKALKYLSDF